MSLFSRFGSLLRADMHAVLDRIEEPEALLRQALREMEEALAEDCHADATLRVEAERLERRRAEMLEAAADAQREIQRSLAASREDLARASIRRRLEHEALARVLERRLRDLGEQRAQLARRIEERKPRLDAMRQKAELLARVPPPADGLCDTPRPVIREEDIELALMAERERRAAS
jgi:phage shock protein A